MGAIPMGRGHGKVLSLGTSIMKCSIFMHDHSEVLSIGKSVANCYLPRSQCRLYWHELIAFKARLIGLSTRRDSKSNSTLIGHELRVVLPRGTCEMKCPHFVRAKWSIPIWHELSELLSLGTGQGMFQGMGCAASQWSSLVLIIL